VLPPCPSPLVSLLLSLFLFPSLIPTTSLLSPPLTLSPTFLFFLILSSLPSLPISPPHSLPLQSAPLPFLIPPPPLSPLSLPSIYHPPLRRPSLSVLFSLSLPSLLAFLPFFSLPFVQTLHSPPYLSPPPYPSLTILSFPLSSPLSFYPITFAHCPSLFIYAYFFVPSSFSPTSSSLLFPSRLLPPSSPPYCYLSSPAPPSLPPTTLTPPTLTLTSSFPTLILSSRFLSSPPSVPFLFLPLYSPFFSLLLPSLPSFSFHPLSPPFDFLILLLPHLFSYPHPSRPPRPPS